MANRRGLNRTIQRELRLLAAQGVITEAQYRSLRERYPAGPWDVAVLVRWFALLGAITAGAGVLLFVGRQMAPLLAFELLFGATTPGFLLFGRWLERARALPKVGAAVQLLGCFCLTGLTVALGMALSSGSGNWPLLIGIDTAVLFGLAYWNGNRLIAVYACANLFAWLGGQTGYLSGWGAYYLGMSYPLRFVVAGVAFTGLGLWHIGSARIRWASHFGRVYLHFGLLVANLALWILSLFGNTADAGWSDNSGERLAYTLLWAAASIASMAYGLRRHHATFRAYGLVFALINLYTVYFQFIVARSVEGWFVHLLVVGGSLLALGRHLEGKRRRGEPAIPRALARVLGGSDRP